MHVKALLTRLPEGAIASMALGDPAADVYTTSFLTATTADVDTLREDVLYFGDATMLPGDVPDDRMLSCVLYGSGDAADVLGGGANVNVVSLADDADPYACFNALQEYFIEDQRQTAVIRRMLAAHFSNRGLQYLVEEAAMALGNPIVVVDTTYRYVAHHLGALEGDDTQVARVMAAEIDNETVLDNAVTYIRDEQIDARIAQIAGPLVHHNRILDCTTMTSAVMVRGVCVAHVMMMESVHPFDSLDRECFARLALFVGQEMQKSEVWGPTSGERGSYFLANLLADQQPSEAVTRRRLKAINFHPKRRLYLILLHAQGPGLSQEQVEQLAGQLRPILHHALYTRYRCQLAILLSRDEEERLEEHVEPALANVAALNGLSVGVSNAFAGVTGTHGAYGQARAALRYGSASRQALDEGGIYHYADYAPLHLIDLAGRRTSLAGLCDPALLRLQEYDAAHGSELMDTLFCYLQVSGSTTRAAALLSLHKNTLLYRMNRIREVLGCSLMSGEDQFRLQLSFRILMHLGSFVPRINARRRDLQGR